jgi:hypothetical protein
VLLCALAHGRFVKVLKALPFYTYFMSLFLVRGVNGAVRCGGHASRALAGSVTSRARCCVAAALPHH